ncbi:redoxin family protein [Actinoplanes sp. NEAU-A12]|uniref:Redoxin family protein n=1 Tax=Actinoplanes sandaracinus TaxID=3045177 RepID=A0ABT6WRH7_9ACTN|nr:MerR family transcriptional regulator [Actinoplanes sandaracinus]MDI6102342.1 redoxin family protein [Actinoplanes sandaracinus]
MYVGELAGRTGATVRALRYYEAAGLVVPRREPNGYRVYEPVAVRQVERIRALTGLGLSVEETRAFVECLADGGDTGDECPASLAAYRRAIVDLEDRIARLAEHRDSLRAGLAAATARMASHRGVRRRLSAADPSGLPGERLPPLSLAATDGRRPRLDRLGPGRTVIFVYPLTGRPGVDQPEGWDTIPGARGCTVEACDFRDRYAELREAGAARVYGLSAQSRAYQREVVHRLHLPYPMLADPRLTVAEALGLPTFEAGGMTLYRRLTLIVSGGVIEHVFHPVDEPGTHAAQIVDWLTET